MSAQQKSKSTHKSSVAEDYSEDMVDEVSEKSSSRLLERVVVNDPVEKMKRTVKDDSGISDNYSVQEESLQRPSHSGMRTSGGLNAVESSYSPKKRETQISSTSAELPTKQVKSNRGIEEDEIIESRFSE